MSVPEAVQTAVIEAVVLVTNTPTDYEAVWDRLQTIADHTSPKGSELYGACFAWATGLKIMAKLPDSVTTDIVPLPGAEPTFDDTDRVTAVAAYLAAVWNGDNEGACKLWFSLEPEKSIALTWDVLNILGAEGRYQLEAKRHA